MSFISVPVPQVGESFTSLLMRIAEKNALGGISEVLEKIGVKAGRADHACFTKLGEVELISRNLGIGPAEIESRMLASVPDTFGRQLVALNTVPIRRKFLLTKTRRFAPSALKAAPCHRAVWDLQPLCHCSKTFEKLLSCCPQCGTPCSWAGASLTACHVCGFDFRFASTVKSSEDEAKAVRWFASLYSEDPRTRLSAWSLFPAELRNLDHVTQVDILLLFGSLSFDPVEEGCRNELRRLRNGDFSLWSSSKLLAGMRILGDWPHNFFELVRVLRNKSDRSDSDRSNRQGSIGSLANLLRSNNSNKILADVFRPLILEGIARADNSVLRDVDHKRNQVIISQKEIRERYRFSKATVAKLRLGLDLEVGRDFARGRAHLFERERFEQLMELRNGLETCNLVSKRTRIPIPALRILVDNGYLPSPCPEASILVGAKHIGFEKFAVERYISSAIEKHGCCVFKGERLGTYLHFAAFHGRGWSDALECVIDGRVQCAIDNSSMKKFAYKIIVDPMEMDACLRKVMEAEGNAVPLGLAACVMKIEARTLHKLVQKSRSSTSQNGILTIKDFEYINGKFATVRKLSSELEITIRAVNDILQLCGCAPILPKDENYQPIYMRDAALNIVKRHRSKMARLQF